MNRAPRRLDWTAALLAGAAHALSFAPWNLPALQIAALAALFFLVERSVDARRALRAGFAFGLGWFGVGISWIYISLHAYGELPAWLSALATLALAALLAVFPAAATGAARRWSADRWRLPLGLPACWALAEWLRGVVFTGFPWLASGYAHTDGPLAGFAPLTGVYGLNLIAALLAAAAAWVALALPAWRAHRAGLAAALAGATLLLAGGQALRSVEWSQPFGAPITVRLAQGNIPQDIKFTGDGMRRSIEAYTRLIGLDRAPGDTAAAAAPRLIVLPESAFPDPVDDLPLALQQSLHDVPRRLGAALVFGVFIEEPGQRYYNSAIGLPADEQPLQRYSKRHLVPFGEFIPFGFRWFTDLLQMPIGDQQRGEPYQPPMRLAGQRIAVNICYEDLFGAEILAAWNDPANQPTLLLNLSNLAWFDDSIALPQHLQISRMRAIETARPLARATNTGATAIVDEHGRVLAQLPPLTQAALDGRVQGRTGNTPYVRLGDFPALLVALLLLGLATALSRRRATANGAAAQTVHRGAGRG